MMMACSRKKFWNSRTVGQLLVSNPPLMFSSSVFLFNPVISWLDFTNFALPGYEGISFLAIFNLSLKVELGEECNGRYRGLSDEFEAFSYNSVAFSSSLSTPNKPKGLEGMTFTLTMEQKIHARSLCRWLVQCHRSPVRRITTPLEFERIKLHVGANCCNCPPTLCHMMKYHSFTHGHF